MMENNHQDLKNIGAVILAAGRSSRMGQPKMTLPWGNTTVIGKVVSSFLKTGIIDIVVVTGGAHQQTEQALNNFPVKMIYNPVFAEKEMLVSLQMGIKHLDKTTRAFFIALGDHPQIDSKIIHQMIDIYLTEQVTIIVPSYQMKRGHPWLVCYEMGLDLLAVDETSSLRDFLNQNHQLIRYLNVNSPGVLKDLDTPEEYQQEKPQ